jgi:sec-independent protein translocase protein TatA
MAGLGAPELIIVLLLFVLLFGAKKLPDLGGSIGKGIKNFKKGVSDSEAGEDDYATTSAAASKATAEPVAAVPAETGAESAERLQREQRVE